MNLEDIKNALNNLVNVEIRTVVGNFTHDADGPPKRAADSKEIYTRINLLEGDISTYFNEEFLEGSLSSVRQYHAMREKNGLAIVQENIDALQKMVGLIATIGKQEKEDEGKEKGTKIEEI
ncbi:MAG: hypothetical protein GY862_11690 [Gammaproteobacteria bacterium]|nr:hypothetical protein [Gammaproteobacteria bacterium]